MMSDKPTIRLEYKLLDGTTGEEIALGTVTFEADSRETKDIYDGQVYVASLYREWKPSDFAVLTGVEVKAHFQRPGYSNHPTEKRPRAAEEEDASSEG